ncbi:hypothetical protein [Acrocarpospora corrugata]|nr:hypothetical protein [Acrocarpospora corrugata]
MHCLEEERRDLANIAMLNCVLGCNALHEHGYIAVGHGGQILISDAALTSAGLARHIGQFLKGRTAPWWNQTREPYFAWHRIRTFKADIP